MRREGHRWLIAAMALLLGACSSLSEVRRDQAQALAEAARQTRIDCERPDACAESSELHALGGQALAASSEAAPRHYAMILDYGQDALLARLNLIRSATRSIDVQTYIFDEDDAGHLVMDELLAAARRGVRVRLLIDQLSALKRVPTLAALVGSHVNFELRIYNPVLDRARISYPMYALAAACCWRRLNQRMHGKLLLVDGHTGITGGRNYQDSYYDWDPEYNFRDRDLLVAGPVVREMTRNFEQFWDAPLSRRPERLSDVGRFLLANGVPEREHVQFTDLDRVARMSRDASDAQLIRQRLLPLAIPVRDVEFIADAPAKHGRRGDGDGQASTEGLQALFAGTREELLLQTPYLVLSRRAQALFRQLRARGESAPRVVVSTNSLAATDSFITYALSYKYKRRYLRDLGFIIHEYKPFPENAPFDLEATGAVELQPEDANADADAVRLRPRVAGSASGSVSGTTSARTPREVPMQQRQYSALRYAGIRVNERVPLSRAGVRVGLHSKSLVVDGAVGVVGTHNFDPRGDRLNTESAVVVRDARFAGQLAASIRRDIAPENSWIIAPRQRSPLLPGLQYSVAKASEALPLFDLLPIRYATSYQFVRSPQCPQPLSPYDSRFHQCHVAVGDFPEASLSVNALLTRIVTAFGAGLAPIL